LDGRGQAAGLPVREQGLELLQGAGEDRQTRGFAGREPGHEAAEAEQEKAKEVGVRDH
jgi:hypothetical protein